jgi:hypothetical protein
MPSLPIGGFFSFFTSTTKQKDANSDKKTPSIHVESSEEEDDDDEEEEKEEKEENKSSAYSVTSTIMHYFTTNIKNKNNTSQTDTRTADDIGIITWDPLKDERDPIVSFNKDDSVDSSSFDHLSVSSSNTVDARPTLAHRASCSSRHLVEMLGIDGTKLDSSIYHDQHEQSNNIWVDLNEELHKPGPALTSPGESRAQVAQDMTVTDQQEEQDGCANQINVDALPGKRRMDHVLQPDSVMSMIANEYLVGLRAHFSYWTNKDFIWHMLRKIENRDE